MTDSQMNEDQRNARDFLAGKDFAKGEAERLAESLAKANQIGLARQVLERMRVDGTLRDGPLKDKDLRRIAPRQAIWTSKDPDLPTSWRHDRAIQILESAYELNQDTFDNAEILGIAGGICKRRWQDLGRLEDLQRAARYYERGAAGPLGDDAYCQINAVFLDELLASLGDNPESRRQRAEGLRERILMELPELNSWWNAATRAEAHAGQGHWVEAEQALKSATARPALWELQTTARQLAELVRLRPPGPEHQSDFEAFAKSLLPGAVTATEAMTIGKVGLALSGGGFRASFYHLGVLARLAESDMLRHIEVLSCVSGGSIVGAMWWLMLRQRLQQPQPMQRIDYVNLIEALINDFSTGVASNPRKQAQSLLGTAWGFVIGAHGALNPVKMAEVLDKVFYRPLTRNEFGDQTVQMHQLLVKPADHQKVCGGDPEPFNPTRHNWLRPHKMPALVLNATTVNTGHAWQFTNSWMGESPWAMHEATDSVQRLEWDLYDARSGWTVDLAKAVAASACVPGVFEPVTLGSHYGSDINVQLVDGGVFDNQGTASLVAMNCNVLLVSDACGQLLFEPQPQELNLTNYGKRTMDAIMERVRGASMSDLAARRLSGQVRSLMVLHMKEDLVVEPRLRSGALIAQTFRSTPLTACGIRREFQQALAELRTDLDAFTEDERLALMACGYQMANHAIARDLANEAPLVGERIPYLKWPFLAMLEEITSTESATSRRVGLLEQLKAGSKRKII